MSFNGSFSPVSPYYNHGSLCGFQWVHIKPYGLCGSLCGSILQPWSGVSVDLCVVPSGSMVQLWVLCATNRFRKLLLNDGVANAQTMKKNSMFCNPFLCEFALHIHTKMHSIISNAANITYTHAWIILPKCENQDLCQKARWGNAIVSWFPFLADFHSGRFPIAGARVKPGKRSQMLTVLCESQTGTALPLPGATGHCTPCVLQGILHSFGIL